MTYVSFEPKVAGGGSDPKGWWCDQSSKNRVCDVLLETTFLNIDISTWSWHLATQAALGLSESMDLKKFFGSPAEVKSSMRVYITQREVARRWNLKWKCGWWTFWVPPPKKSLVNGLQRNKRFWYHRGHSEFCIDLQLMCVFDSLCFWHQSWQIEWFFHLNSCEPTMRAISNVHQCRYLKHEKIYQLSQQTCPLFAWQSERNRFYCDQPHLKTSWFNVGFGTVSFATHDPNTVNFNPLKEWAALTKNGDQLKPVFVNAFLYFFWGVRSGLEFQSYHPTDEFFQISRSFPIISALRENPLVVRRSIVFAVPRCYGSFAWRGKCHIVAWQKQGRREGQLWSSVGGPTDFCESHGFKGTVPKVLKQAAQLDMWHVDFIERSRGAAGFWANEQNVWRGYLEKLQILTSIAVNCGAASAEAISHQLRISESLTPERYPGHLSLFFGPKKPPTQKPRNLWQTHCGHWRGTTLPAACLGDEGS